MKRKLIPVLLILLCLITSGCTPQKKKEALPDPETARFATMQGSSQEKQIEELYPRAEVLRYESFPDVLLALREGLADYALLSEQMTRVSAEDSSGFVILRDNISVSEVGAAVNKNNPSLLKALNECIRDMMADGTLKDMEDRWIVTENRYRPMEIPKADGKNGVLRVGTSAGYPPLEFVLEGQYAGFDIELAKRIALKLDKKLEIVNIPFTSLLVALQTGQIDVILSGMTITGERKQAVDFTEAYLKDKTVLMRYDAEAAKALPDPKTAHFAALTGSNSAELIREAYPDATLTWYETTPDCILAVNAGKADYTAVTYYNTLPVLEAWPNLDTIDPGLQVKQIAMAVAKGNAALLDSLNDLLARWRADGTLKDMEDRWFRRDRNYSPVELPEPPEGAQRLRVGVVSTQEPFCFMSDGAYAGFDVELTARIADALGMAVEYVDVPMASLFAGLETGSIDVVASAVGVTPERAQIVDFTDCYVENPVVLVCRKTAADKPEQTSFLAGLRNSFRRTFITESRWRLILKGLWLTLVISLLFGVFGTALGFCMCLLKRSRNPIPRLLIDGLCDLIQGVPMVVFLMVLNYVVFIRAGLSGEAVSVIGFSLVFGCAVCGMLTVGLDGVNPGELEAGLALGYTPTQVFFKIGLPQAVRQVLPLYRGEFVGTMKLTSIVGYIAVQDLTKAGDLIRSRTLEAFFPLIVTAVLYYLMAKLLSLALRLVERRISPKHRKRTVKGVRP